MKRLIFSHKLKNAFVKLLSMGSLLIISGCTTDGTRQEILNSAYQKTQKIAANYKYLAPCWETHRSNIDILGRGNVGEVFFQLESGEFFPRAIVNEPAQTAELRVGDPNYHVLMILSARGKDSTVVTAFAMMEHNFTAVIPRWFKVLRYCEKEYATFKNNQ